MIIFFLLLLAKTKIYFHDAKQVAVRVILNAIDFEERVLITHQLK